HPARSGNEPAAVIRTRLEGATRHPEPLIEGLEKLARHQQLSVGQ
ncbi:MAG: hypothetical protein HC889_17795, partial [Synechococcaceae cyanobacterium SM1_2_3]|nr:hypothetical protein [Synechococcaceae cyanobacterium SM1_2_3]